MEDRTFELSKACDVLGVKPPVSSIALKTAHWDLLNVWHPDRFGFDARLRVKAEEETKKINASYTLLREEIKVAGSVRFDTAPRQNTMVRESQNKPARENTSAPRRNTSAKQTTNSALMYVSYGAYCAFFMAILFLLRQVAGNASYFIFTIIVIAATKIRNNFRSPAGGAKR